ncbi:CZB domain-containing protein [Sulfurivirga caldicuralii]
MQRAFIATEKGADSDEAKAVFVDHHNCRLGKWYYEGYGKKRFADLPAYRELEPWHAQVHTGVHRALEAAREDWMHDDHALESIITAMREAQEASHHVIQLIDALLQQRHSENPPKNA